uniref:Uncharacterized protein n=1 Tax=Ixodes ricinus TaxID=34613 RepID=A0A6B0TVN2_IXORI
MSDVLVFVASCCTVLPPCFVESRFRFSIPLTIRIFNYGWGRRLLEVSSFCLALTALVSSAYIELLAHQEKRKPTLQCT